MAFYLEKGSAGSSPYLLIDEANNRMLIKGESYHENVIEFFADVNEWLDERFVDACDEFTFDCELTYFNSSTAKLLMDILLLLDEYAADGKEITVNWYADEGNDIVIECGEDFKEEMESLTFNIVIR